VQVAPVAAQELEVEAPEPVWGRVEELEQRRCWRFNRWWSWAITSTAATRCQDGNG